MQEKVVMTASTVVVIVVVSHRLPCSCSEQILLRREYYLLRVVVCTGVLRGIRGCWFECLNESIQDHRDNDHDDTFVISSPQRRRSNQDCE